MDTKKYALFEKIVETGSLTRAGESCGMTQSGVSHVLTDLERELGVPLLRRSRTGVRLTPEGERLYPLLREILRREETLKSAAGELAAKVTGTVRIGTFTSVAVQWLPGMMQAFQAENPNAEFRLYNGDYGDVEGWIDSRQVDVAFVALPAELKCTCIPLWEDRLLAVLPRGHRLAEGKTCSVREIAREPFISLLAASDNDARRAMEQAGTRPNVRFTTKDDYAIIAMAAQGLGVSILPELLLQGRQEKICALPLDPPASRTIALALPEGERAVPAAKRFAAFARGWVEEWKTGFGGNKNA